MAEVTSSCDWRIEDLVNGERPVSLYLVVPPSDISRTKPLVRLILNQIGRRLTEKLDGDIDGNARRQVLLMLDEFPALGRLEFFESALAFMAGYGLRAFLITQSLNQIEKAYGPNNSILDNCHVRVAFATNDERTAKRISDALGTTTEMRAMRNYAGHRLAPWLSHVMVSRQETARQLLTPGEVMQLANEDEIILVSGVPPIRANKIRYYADKNFKTRVTPAPVLNGPDHPYGDCPPPRRDDWGSRTADVHQDLFEASKDKTDTATTSVSGGKEQAPELDERSKTKLKPDAEVEIDDVNLDGQSEVALPETIARTTDVLDRATPGQNMMGFSR